MINRNIVLMDQASQIFISVNYVPTRLDDDFLRDVNVSNLKVDDIQRLRNIGEAYMKSKDERVRCFANLFVKSLTTNVNVFNARLDLYTALHPQTAIPMDPFFRSICVFSHSAEIEQSLLDFEIPRPMPKTRGPSVFKHVCSICSTIISGLSLCENSYMAYLDRRCRSLKAGESIAPQITEGIMLKNPTIHGETLGKIFQLIDNSNSFNRAIPASIFVFEVLAYLRSFNRGTARITSQSLGAITVSSIVDPFVQRIDALGGGAIDSTYLAPAKDGDVWIQPNINTMGVLLKDVNVGNLIRLEGLEQHRVPPSLSLF